MKGKESDQNRKKTKVGYIKKTKTNVSFDKENNVTHTKKKKVKSISE